MRTYLKVKIFKGNGQPLLSEKTGRNSLCKCGSGKKAKHCCGTDTNYYQQTKNKNQNEQIID